VSSDLNQTRTFLLQELIISIFVVIPSLIRRIKPLRAVSVHRHDCAPRPLVRRRLSENVRGRLTQRVRRGKSFWACDILGWNEMAKKDWVGEGVDIGK
jgi:hypothetical protein